MPRELIAFTGDDGVASVRVVPGSHLTIELECGGMFSKENSTIKLVMGNESRQFQVGWSRLRVIKLVMGNNPAPLTLPLLPCSPPPGF